AEAVEGRATLYRHPKRRHVTELDRVVLTGHDRLSEIAANLLGVHVEGGDELHIGDVIVTEADVHQTGDAIARIGVPVVVDALNQRRGAVADADDCDTDGAHHGSSLSDLDGRSGWSEGGLACGDRPERSFSMSSSSHLTSRSQAARPRRC